MPRLDNLYLRQQGILRQLLFRHFWQKGKSKVDFFMSETAFEVMMDLDNLFCFLYSFLCNGYFIFIDKSWREPKRLRKWKLYRLSMKDQ